MKSGEVGYTGYRGMWSFHPIIYKYITRVYTLSVKEESGVSSYM
jgi:hypothetical protein